MPLFLSSLAQLRFPTEIITYTAPALGNFDLLPESVLLRPRSLGQAIELGFDPISLPLGALSRLTPVVPGWEAKNVNDVERTNRKWSGLVS